MKTKDNWTYTCKATIARKYIVASVTTVRTTAETLSVPTLRYAHQAMTRNAERSKFLPAISNLRDFTPAAGTTTTTHQTWYQSRWEST